MTKPNRINVLTGITIFLGAAIWLYIFSDNQATHKPDTLSYQSESMESKASQPTSVAIESNTTQTETLSDALQTEQSNLNAEQTSKRKQQVDEKLQSIESELQELEMAMNDLMSRADPESDASTDPTLNQQIKDLSNQHETLAYEYIENSFAAEEVDPAWEAEANSQISEGLANIESLSSSVVQCATTMCRITASTNETDDNNAMSVMHLFDDKLNWEGQMYITINHESGNMTAFLARPGNELPQVTN